MFTENFCVVTRTYFFGKIVYLGRLESKSSEKSFNQVVIVTQNFSLLTKLIFLAIYDILGSFVFEHISATS